MGEGGRTSKKKSKGKSKEEDEEKVKVEHKEKEEDEDKEQEQLEGSGGGGAERKREGGEEDEQGENEVKGKEEREEKVEEEFQKKGSVGRRRQKEEGGNSLEFVKGLLVMQEDRRTDGASLLSPNLVLNLLARWKTFTHSAGDVSPPIIHPQNLHPTNTLNQQRAMSSSTTEPQGGASGPVSSCSKGSGQP